MTKTDNSLRAQTIMLTMKALEVISNALDIIAADGAADGAADISHGTDTDISHGTDTELTRMDTDEKRKDTDESLCAATPLPKGGASGGGASEGGAGGEASWRQPWRPITDRDLNTLTIGQLLAGGQSWGYGMVAQARGMSPDHGNSLVPMLIGAQQGQHGWYAKQIHPQ